MSRRPRTLSVILGLAGLASAGACTGCIPIDKTILRVRNESTSGVRVDAWTRPPGVAAAIASPDHVVLAPGEEKKVRVENPKGEVNPPLTIRVQPSGGSDLPGMQGEPVWLELAPPEPFRVVIEGEPGDIVVRRR